MDMSDHHMAASPVTWLVPFLLMGIVLVCYLVAVVWQGRMKHHWSHWRTASFVVGISLLMVGMAPQVADFAHHDLRGHMVQHLLIGMFAPLGLVMAAPVTLLLRTLPIRSARRVTTVLRSQLIGWLSHPITALLANVGGMYLLYLTPLYAFSQTNAYLHDFIHLHFLVAGCLFTWVIAGPDPAPHRPQMSTRLIVLFISIAAHANLSKFMYAYNLPQGTTFDEAQIRAAAQLMYYGGDIAEILLTIAFFAAWYRIRGRSYARLYPQML